MEIVQEHIEGETVVMSWSMLDTKIGVLTVHVNNECFNAELYAGEVRVGGKEHWHESRRGRFRSLLAFTVLMSHVGCLCARQGRSGARWCTTYSSTSYAMSSASARTCMHTHSPTCTCTVLCRPCNTNLPLRRLSSLCLCPCPCPSPTQVDVYHPANDSPSCGCSSHTSHTSS